MPQHRPHPPQTSSFYLTYRSFLALLASLIAIALALALTGYPLGSALSTLEPIPRMHNVLRSAAAHFQRPASFMSQSSAHFASPSASAPDTEPEPAAPRPDTTRQPSTQTHTSAPAPLALPSTSKPDASSPHTLDLSDPDSGNTVKLDHLGPMVVNVDGTLSRISNWDTMTEQERANTVRVLGKRNKQRLEKLKAAEGEEDRTGGE